MLLFKIGCGASIHICVNVSYRSNQLNHHGIYLYGTETKGVIGVVTRIGIGFSLRIGASLYVCVSKSFKNAVANQSLSTKQWCCPIS